MKMATLEEEKARRKAIQFCMKAVMTSKYDSFNHLKKHKHIQWFFEETCF